MANKRYFWLKLKDDFFTQPKIKKLRKIAGGDTFTIIYLKMQLLSIKAEGKIWFEGIEPTFIEELALTLDEDIENVQMTLAYLKAQGLIVEGDDDEFTLPETIECIGSETRDAERKRNKRNQEKMELKLKNGQCPQIVQKCPTEIDIDKEIDKEIDIDCLVKELPLKNGSYFSIRKTECDRLQKTYNKIDVLNELQKMREWLDANPTRRKTPSGINRFIINWLNSATPQETKQETIIKTKYDV